MQRYISEYRINKEGCECYRSPSLAKVMERLEYLKARSPHVNFDIQSRHARLNKHGVTERDWRDRTIWSIWS